MKLAILAAIVAMMGCGYQPTWDLYVEQNLMSALPQSGQEIYAPPGKTQDTMGYVVSAELGDFKDTHNLYHMTVDGPIMIVIGQQLTWPTGTGTVVESIHLQLYGITGSL